MTKLSKSKTREIIEDFAQEIKKCKVGGKPPTKAVINFRNEGRDGIERDICYVPIVLLRYRKDNGRISSDVLAYEKNHGLLDEGSEESQDKIEQYLIDRDKSKTEELYNSIKHEGQREPAIITCDGFLINGNRRKMVMKRLSDLSPGNKKYDFMKVVILPGKNDPGGSPTLLEIEEIENRYQYQSEGKAEYYAFDRALSMRRKIEIGMTLRQQILDDPIYSGLEEKKLKEAIKKYENDYLKPLECIDRYLYQLRREGLYSTVSSGLGDPEGRWQAFLDYYKSVYQKISDESKRIEMGINEGEIGKIENVAFKLIRKRTFPGLPKVHQIMRDLPKWIENKDAKKELLKIVDIELEIPKEERVDADSKEYDEKQIDEIWVKRHEAKINNHVIKAHSFFQYSKEKDTPLDLLEAALKKLEHENMNTKNIRLSDIKTAMELARKIQARAGELEGELYRHQKDVKCLKDKYNS